MIKTLTNLFKQDKEKFVVPKGVQDVIPVVAIFDDGIFKVGKDKYSKTYRFTDINYAVASREDKEAMFLEYSELLNSLDSGATTKITINNRRLNRLDFEQTILIPTTGDNLDEYREEYNKMLLDKATGANSIVQDKYITISINKKSVEDARTYFARVGADLIAHFGRLGSKCVELDSILNRITQNRAKGKNTFIFIDEIYLLFQHEYSANFLFTLWKRVRKYGAYASGITQNVDDLLQSHTARTMLANSEFIIMLNQASTDRLELAKLLNISDLQMSYITNVEAGHGLIKVGSSLVPFANKFPKNTKLYKLMTTKPGEA